MKAPELKERLEESEKLIQDMTVTWEDKLRKTEAVAQVATRKHANTQDGVQNTSPWLSDSV